MFEVAARDRVFALAIAAIAAIAAFRGAAAPAATIPIAEFSVPTAGAGPGGIVAGPEGDLWFTEIEANKIARITPAGAIVDEFPVPGSLLTELPAGIVLGPDGNLWFTELESNLVGRLTPAGVVTRFQVPTPNSAPTDIVAGPDGNLWLTENAGNRIARITPAGAFKEFPVPTAGSGPAGIAAGPDGNLWFTESAANKIGRLSIQGTFHELDLPDAGSDPEPAKIVAGPDGNLWFTEIGGNNVGRVTPAGVFAEFPTPTANAGGAIIAPGPDGNLWFTEISANQIGRITPAGVITEYQVPTAGSGPAGITAGPDGNVWFTELNGNLIGRVAVAGSSTCVAGPATLCIDDQPGDRRWQITATYKTAEGGGLAGNAQAIALSTLGVDEGGLLWFFDAANPEMLVKVINACALNQRFWVFYSATTNVGFTVVVKDTRTGRTKSYQNRDGVPAPPVQDSAAFACSPQGDLAGGAASAAGGGAGSAGGVGPRFDAAVPAAGSACATTATTLCIDQRFMIAVNYKTVEGGGRAGAGQAIGLTSLGVAQGGLFWFFAMSNPEMLIKVIDGCSLNGHYWVFYAAGTNAGFTVTVTDRQTGRQRTYGNADGTAAPPEQDTSALPCQ